MIIEMVKRGLAEMEAAEFGSRTYDDAAYSVWLAIESAGREQLVQLLKHGPVYDGDVVSKLNRDALIQCGIAVRCCFRGEQGYTAARYIAFTLHSVGLERSARKHPNV